MTRAYALDLLTRDVKGLIDQSWTSLRYVRRYYGMDTFELTINRSRLWASELQKGRFLYLPDEGDRIFLIEQIASLAEGSASNDEMTVSGRSLEGIAMEDRHVLPPAGQDYDKQTAIVAETAIKHYVDLHAGPGAAVARRVPDLVIAASAGAGAAVTVAGRYQRVFDIVREIGLLAGMGWEITYDEALDDFVFKTILGVDRSASVFFDFAFDTLERWEELESILESKTVAIVAGQGEGKDREVQTRWQGAEPTGFARREAFLDARDVDLGDTTTLQQRGDAFLAASTAERRLEAGVHQYGSFKYGEHWDLGDLVLVRNEERGISYTARVVEVEKAFGESAAAPIITAALDRPFPTERERVEGGGARGGAVDYPDTLNPKVDSLWLSRLNPDVKFSRPSTKTARIDDGAGGAITLEVNGIIKGQAVGATGDVLWVGNDAKLVDVGQANMVGVQGLQDGTLGGIVFGSAGDTDLFREGPDKLKTNDLFRAAGGLDGMTVHAAIESGALTTDKSTTSGTYVDIGAPFDQSVTAPPSGRVLLLAVLVLSDPDTIGADVNIAYQIDTGADVNCGGHAFDAHGVRQSITVFDVITGLTPGTSYSVSLRWLRSSGTAQITGASRGAAGNGSRMLLLPLT